MKCRNCGFDEFDVEGGLGFIPEVDLGYQPAANDLALMEWQAKEAPKFRLCAVKCPVCDLVQLVDTAVNVFPSDYPYRQGQSATWVAHLRDFCETVPVLGDDCYSLDVGANDGTLVKMLRDRDWRAYGVDPSPQHKMVIPGRMGYAFARTWSIDLPKFELITAFNVLAHVPNLDDFLKGIKMLLAPEGQFVIEVPDWEKSTWDQVYHEHMSYFTAATLSDVLVRRGFEEPAIIHVPTHGGSLRAVCGHA